MLWQYDIAVESYRQCFRAAKPRPGESNRELAARLEDLAGNWKKLSELLEEHLTHIQMVLEQLCQAGLTAKARKYEFGASECGS